MNRNSKSIAIITSGSRGDVQPFVALALGLQQKGHQVVLATHEEFRAWVESYGLNFKTLAGDPKALISSEEGQQFLTSRNPFKFLLGAKRLNTKAAEMLHEQMRTGLSAAEGSEALICSFSAPLSFFVSEKLRIPSICVALAPISRTSSFPPIILSPKNFGPKLNRMCHRVFELVVDLLLRKNIKMIRLEHDLTPLPLGRRFPADFMFQLSAEEFENWKSRNVISNPGDKMGLRKLPYAFTEHGVAMLSSVLRSDQAIEVNIAIMRTFTKLRRILANNKELAKKLENLKRNMIGNLGLCLMPFES